MHQMPQARRSQLCSQLSRLPPARGSRCACLLIQLGVPVPAGFHQDLAPLQGLAVKPAARALAVPAAKSGAQVGLLRMFSAGWHHALPSSVWLG